MLKKIKKSLKYFVIIFGVILLLPTVLYLLLQTSEVQTFIIKRISNHFSSQIKSTMSVGSIEYKFFNKLSVNDIIIKDQNNDTLIYSKAITVGIKVMNFTKKSFRFGKVSLIKPVIAIITDSSGLMNLTWYLDKIKNPADTVKKAGSRFVIDQIDINDARFSMINRRYTKGKSRIDFNNLNLSGINGTIEELKIINDTTSFSVRNIGFKESSGFRVKRINSSVVLARQNVILNSAFIILDSSILNIPKLALVPDSSGSYKNFTEKVKLDIRLDKSLINTSDLKYFMPFADSLNESVWLSGKIQGTVSELRGRNIKLSYRNFTSLDCDFDFSGLPKIENAYMYIGVNSLRTNAKDFEKINMTGKGSLVVPEPIKKLGNISFNGSFTGFTTDFVTYGEIRTSQGNIRTDISLRPEKSKRYRIKGLITGSDINLGELTGKTDFLGNLSMKANVDGYAYSFKKFAADLTGKIDSIEINRYIYRNIALNGSCTEKTWDGSVKINDKNIKLDLLGLLNFKNEIPEFDCTLNIANANLYKLNFDKLDTSSNVKMLLTSNFKGNNIDNLDGEIKLLNSKFRKFSNDLELYDFAIRTYKENNEPVLSLRTDFLDADIIGYYNFATLGDLVKSTLVTLMPSQFHIRGKQNNFKKNKFTFNIDFKNTDKLNNFLRTGISISDKGYIKGVVFADSIIKVSGKADLLAVKNNVFKDFSFDANVSGSALTMSINSTSLTLLKQTELKDFTVGLTTKPDNFIFDVNWDNKDKILNQGSFVARGQVVKNTSGKPNTFLKVDIDSSRIYSDNNLWKLKNSSILVDSNTIIINKLFLTSNDRSYLVDGTVSENPADTLHLEFKGIDIAPLNYLVNRKNNDDPNAVHLDFKGRLNGKILLTNVYKSLLLMGNVIINNFSVLDTEFGNISIKSELDNTKKGVNLNVSNSLNSVKTFDISGLYDPPTKKLDLNVRAAKMPIGFLNPLLKSFASEINGSASGNLNLSGDLSVEYGKLVLKGAVMAENASMKINYLQTKYTMNDSVRFDNEGIRFNNVKLKDPKGNVASLNGSVNHKYFHDYTADIIITINSNSFQVLNTQPKDNAMFYGTAYVSKNDVAKIKTDQNSLSIDISAKTGKNSKLAIPLNKGLSVSEYSYITFEDTSKIKKLELGNTPAKQLVMDLNMNLEVTPDAEIQIIFDEKLGDVMKGHGSSENLNINLNKKGDFKITGDYVIENGDYTFTYGNILNKTFDVENGGKIMFNGNLKDAEIDLKASYLNLKASLSSLPEFEIDKDKYSKRISVEPQLNLSGKLFNPVVGFDIYLPDADEETRTRLQNAISTQEELTRQVSALLFLGTFISSGNSPASTTATSAMAATSFEMISNQVGNMLSQISKNVDIGLNIRPGSNDITPQEAELALSTQILNNKIVLNGNFDVRGAGSTTNNSTSNPSATNNTTQLTGDFNAEAKLTEKLRLKVFNRFNDTYSNSWLSPYTQGVGIFYKQDFNRFSDLFRKKTKPDMKKEEETKIKNK